jgi:three-Cys-motif partner protein
MNNPYEGREQTQAKHNILKRYLQALTFKLMEIDQRELTYVDGFSGPWGAKTQDFSDTSFKIAITVLQDAFSRYSTKEKPRTFRCIFVEKSNSAYKKLKEAVEPYNKPEERFHVTALHGEFEAMAPTIKAQLGRSFALIFIDPTGWTGFSFDKIGPLLAHRPGEVLVNFMYDFVNRASSMADPKTIASLDPILGGPGWQHRLDPYLPTGHGVEQLFRDELRKSGGFKWVVSTPIDRPTSDRELFYIVYGTRSDVGLKTFRDIEYKALKAYETERSQAKQTKRVDRTKQPGLFDHLPEDREQSLDAYVEKEVEYAKDWIIETLRQSVQPSRFGDLCLEVIEIFRLRETNVKDICVDLGRKGVIREPWREAGPRNKPKDDDLIELKRGID